MVKPFRPAELLPVIELSVARFDEFRALEREVGDLREALETRKVVERAKGVLMETLGLREADAFHRIRKTSMDTRKSMREVAEAVLLAHEMERTTEAEGWVMRFQSGVGSRQSEFVPAHLPLHHVAWRSDHPVLTTDDHVRRLASGALRGRRAGGRHGLRSGSMSTTTTSGSVRSHCTSGGTVTLGRT